VDAVCIDEANLAERADQVLLMAEIYSNAYRVLIWLGAESPDSGVAMNTMERLLRFVTARVEASGSPEAASPLTPMLNEGEWTALENVFAKRD
jgi:hypothetical protein